MTLDATLRPAAQRLIKKLGKSATIRRTTKGTFDPATGDYSGDSTNDYSVKVTPPSDFDRQHIDGDLIREDDFMVSVAGKGLSITPDPGDEDQYDTLILDSTTYTIVRVRPVYSGESVAMFTLHCRK